MGIYIKGDFKNPYPNCDECIFGESIRCEAMTRREVYDYDVDCPLSEIEISDKAECDNCIWNVCNYNKIDWEVSEDAISDGVISYDYIKGYREAVQRLEQFYLGEANAPSVVPTTEQSSMVGEWQITDAYPHNVYCSECHKKFAQTHWAVWEDGSLPRNYCPNCGAKMRLE